MIPALPCGMKNHRFSVSLNGAAARAAEEEEIV